MIDRPTFWLLVVVLGIGTYLIRLSFLGLLGNRPLPLWLVRSLRYTAVAVLPAPPRPLRRGMWILLGVVGCCCGGAASLRVPPPAANSLVGESSLVLRVHWTLQRMLDIPVSYCERMKY